MDTPSLTNAVAALANVNESKESAMIPYRFLNKRGSLCSVPIATIRIVGF